MFSLRFEVRTNAAEIRYILLFVWNKEKEELVCAYGLGPTDEILAKQGKRVREKSLYMHTHFDYGDRLLDMGKRVV